MKEGEAVTDIVGVKRGAQPGGDGLVAACGKREFLLFHQPRAVPLALSPYRAFDGEIDRATTRCSCRLAWRAGERVAVQLCTCPEFAGRAVRPGQDPSAVMVPMNDQYLVERKPPSCSSVRRPPARSSEPRSSSLSTPCPRAASIAPQGSWPRTRRQGRGVQARARRPAADPLLRDFSALRGAGRRWSSTERCELSSATRPRSSSRQAPPRARRASCSRTNILFGGLCGDWSVAYAQRPPARHLPFSFQLAALARAHGQAHRDRSTARALSQIREFRARHAVRHMMLRALMLQPESPDDRARAADLHRSSGVRRREGGRSSAASACRS